jgi:hypothetical protein
MATIACGELMMIHYEASGGLKIATDPGLHRPERHERIAGGAGTVHLCPYCEHAFCCDDRNCVLPLTAIGPCCGVQTPHSTRQPRF